jgi:hypothetical protein
MEARRIANAIEDGTRRFVLVWDDLVSPLAYGEYLNFLMVARVLSRAGCEISVLHIEGENRKDFERLSVEPAVSSYILQRQRIARALVGPPETGVSSCSWESFHSSSLFSEQTPDIFVIFHDLVRSRKPVYVHCHLLANILLEGFAQEFLEYSLLVPSDCRNPAEKSVSWVEKPYIAWVARFNTLWAPERNLTEEEFLGLRELLSTIYPNTPVVLISDSVGCAHYSSLARANGLGLQVSKYFSTSFLGDAALLLGAALVLQLRGGGMSSVAQFSRTPYYMIAPVIHEIMWGNDALMPFATADQTFYNSSQWISDEDFRAKTQHLCGLS